ncbi:MAG TPA: hypothetical protein VLA48_03180 [Nitrososphaeraceae archaeon]|nr:hypothetical protein [Nitrososphaeraceae archaeon]
MLENNRNLLGYEEYRLHVYENINKVIVNQNYIEENLDFFEKLLFKMWEIYYRNSNLEPVTIKKQLNHLELFLSMMLEFKPTLELPEDSI